MKSDTLKRIAKQISDWRKEMGNDFEPLEVNGVLLNETLKLLDKAGLSEGLAVYIILACEWSFRIGKISEAEVQNLLREVENGFKSLKISERAIYHVVKALETSIRKTVAEEKRFPIAFPPRPVSDTEREMFGDENFNVYEKQGSENKRLKPSKSVPVRPGPTPWIAPWVTGSLINLYLSQKGIRKNNQILNLMAALLSRESIEEADFKRREASFKKENLEKFLEVVKRDFDRHLSNEEFNAESQGRPKKYWGDVILGERVLRAFAIDLNLVMEIFKSYSTTGKRKTQDGRRK